MNGVRAHYSRRCRGNLSANDCLLSNGIIGAGNEIDFGCSRDKVQDIGQYVLSGDQQDSRLHVAVVRILQGKNMT